MGSVIIDEQKAKLQSKVEGILRTQLRNNESIIVSPGAYESLLIDRVKSGCRFHAQELHSDGSTGSIHKAWNYHELSKVVVVLGFGDAVVSGRL